MKVEAEDGRRFFQAIHEQTNAEVIRGQTDALPIVTTSSGTGSVEVAAAGSGLPHLPGEVESTCPRMRPVAARSLVAASRWCRGDPPDLPVE